MTTITIIPDRHAPRLVRYSAVAGDLRSEGATAGQALDALTAHLPEPDAGALVVIQSTQSDRFFTATQQQRLRELMDKWRAARDANTAMDAAERGELDALVAAELKAATDRAAALAQGLNP
jgi:hypothetical protein